MASDRLYVMDAQNAAKVQAEFANVYFYKFSHRLTSSFSDLLTGTTNNYGILKLSIILPLDSKR